MHTDDTQQRRDKAAKVASKTAARRFLKGWRRAVVWFVVVKLKKRLVFCFFSECGGHSVTLSECRFPREQRLPDDGVLLPRLARARCEDGCSFPRLLDVLRRRPRMEREGRWTEREEEGEGAGMCRPIAQTSAGTDWSRALSKSSPVSSCWIGALTSASS